MLWAELEMGRVWLEEGVVGLGGGWGGQSSLPWDLVDQVQQDLLLASGAC